VETERSCCGSGGWSTDISPRRPMLDSRQVHVKSVVDKVELGQVSRWVLRFSLSVSFHLSSSKRWFYQEDKLTKPGDLSQCLRKSENIGYKIKYFQEQNHSWEADSSSASEEIPHILWYLYVHYRFDKSSRLVPVPCQVNPLYVFPPYFSKINFNILSFMPRFTKLSLFFRFRHQTSCTFSPEQILI
jgi:hypothetical protein